MHFGEFLKANIIEGLEDGYLDYAGLVEIVDGLKGKDKKERGEDSLKMSMVPMPVSTGPTSLSKTLKKVVSVVLTALVLFFLTIRKQLGRCASGLSSCVQCLCCYRKSGGEREAERKRNGSLTDSLLMDEAAASLGNGNGVEGGREETERERNLLELKKIKHEEFLAALNRELAKCNNFLEHKEAELESSIHSLTQTIDGFMTVKGAVDKVSPRSSFYRERSLSDQSGLSNNDSSHVLQQQYSRRNSYMSDDSFDGPHQRTFSKYHAPPPLFQAILREPDTIEHAYREMHVHIMQLKQVATVNLTGFLKAAKKCKKNTDTAIHMAFQREVCCKSEKMDELADKLALSYAKTFTNNNVQKARARLMVYKGSMKPSLKTGFFLGVDVALTFALIWITTYEPAKRDCPFCPTSLVEVIPVYRVIFFPILFIWCWSALVYFWRSYGINYLWILDMNPKTELGIHGSAGLAAVMTSFCLISLVLYTAGVKTGYSFMHLPLYVWPLSLFLVTFLACIFPPGAFYHKSRSWFFKTLALIFQRVVAFIGPEVRFRENYVADVLTSMVAWIVDLETTFYYYASGNGFHPGASMNHPHKFLTAHILTGIPYYYRVQECIRRYVDTQDPWHLVNCGKYMTSLGAICLASIGNYVSIDGNWSAGKIIWFMVLIISTIYCYIWDVCCDWGYVSRKGFRKQIGFTNARWFYKFAMVTNAIGRLGWALTITPYSIIPGLGHQTTKTIAGTLEILRRCQWTLLRVEWEFIENPNKYRSIAQVPILLTFENEVEQIHPMRSTIIAGANLVLVVIVVTVACVHYSKDPNHI